MGALLVALYHIDSPAAQIYVASRVLPNDPAVWGGVALLVFAFLGLTMFMVGVVLVCIGTLSCCEMCLKHFGKKDCRLYPRPDNDIRVRGGGRAVHWKDM